MRVLMDTNALMMPIECDVRVFDELERLLTNPELLVPRAVLDELDELAGSHGEEAVAASVGRDLAERCSPLDHREEYADDACVELATDRRCDLVCTNDRPLRDRLLETGVPVIGARGNTLAITES
ncbi:twitching motility protein PilT [Halococcus sp. IIIV-5B]|nr:MULTISPECIES: twitching motility protein PilT [Halococcus]RJT02711.1 twitching motility protein PilT [Halococcus sp. IIIV-5B]